MIAGYTKKEWKELPEVERLKIQKERHKAWKFLKGLFERTLKKFPYVPGFREEGFKMEELGKRRGGK